MAEEGKEKKGANILKTILKVIIGLAFLALGVAGDNLGGGRMKIHILGLLFEIFQ